MTFQVLLTAVHDYIETRDEVVVTDWFSGFDWNLPPRPIVPAGLPGIIHLPECIAVAGSNEASLVKLLLDLSGQLHWGRSYSREDFGQQFVDNYGYMELAGQRGHFVSQHLVIGFVLFGPQLCYPQHWHTARELYIPLTSGALWSRDEGEFVERASGEIIIHESNMHHAMTMQESPLLALYFWRAPAGREANLMQKSDFR